MHPSACFVRAVDVGDRVARGRENRAATISVEERMKHGSFDAILICPRRLTLAGSSDLDRRN
jgi:hypothetical protein